MAVRFGDFLMYKLLNVYIWIKQNVVEFTESKIEVPRDVPKIFLIIWYMQN